MAFEVARVGALALAAFCSACAGSPTQRSSAPTAAAPPDFELAALDGSSVRLSDYVGKNVVLIDFWATYCEPCLRSMPMLDALYAKYKAQGFVVFGVAIDGPDSLAQVRADVQRLGIHFPILLDQDTRVVALYNPKTSAPVSLSRRWKVARSSSVVIGARSDSFPAIVVCPRTPVL